VHDFFADSVACDKVITGISSLFRHAYIDETLWLQARNVERLSV